jgi:hypothetical protein
MTDVVAIETTLGNGAAGFIALVLFAMAWIVNEKANGRKAGAIIALVSALSGSFVLYASTWSETWCGWLGSILTGIGGLFGAEVSVRFVLCATVVVSLLIIAADLGVNIKDNPWAIGALLVAPVATHGTAGIIGSMAHGFFGGMALAVIDAIKALTGA